MLLARTGKVMVVGQSGGEYCLSAVDCQSLFRLSNAAEDAIWEEVGLIADNFRSRLRKVIADAGMSQA